VYAKNDHSLLTGVRAGHRKGRWPLAIALPAIITMPQKRRSWTVVGTTSRSKIIRPLYLGSNSVLVSQWTVSRILSLSAQMLPSLWRTIPGAIGPISLAGGSV